MSDQKPTALPAFLEGGIPAGFPSQAEDCVENSLDLNELMIQHPTATFFVRVSGDSMRGAGIQEGDILVVDRSLETVSGKIVIAILNGEFTVKRFISNASGVYLVAENSRYPALKIEPESDFQVWGVVTYVIHKAE
jgi:DNA polymerase V